MTIAVPIVGVGLGRLPKKLLYGGNTEAALTGPCRIQSIEALYLQLLRRSFHL
jgi:hypothetical protein